MVARFVLLTQVEHVSDADLAVALERLFPRLYRFARFTLEPDEAQDATASALERMWRQRRRFQPERGPLEGWLAAVGTNAIRDECRRHRRRGHTLSVDDLDIPDDGDLELRIRLADVRTALATLDPRSRELIAMRYALDLPIGDIAATLGRSPNATSVALHRALAMLRSALKDGDVDG